MPTSIYHAKFKNLPKESRAGGHYLRTGLVMDQALFSFVELLPGYVWAEGAPMDIHPFDQMVFIIEGRLEMILNDNDSYMLEQGDALYIPSNVKHAARLVNNERCYLFETFAPLRTDYLYIAEHQTSANAVPREPDGSRIDKRSWDKTFRRPYLQK